jgi:hypothetical protein
MFVRVKMIGAYEYLFLVENAREGGRHVQRVIKAPGRRDEVEASGLIDGLTAPAARRSHRSIAGLGSGPTIDPICRAVGITLPPVFQEMPPAP